MQIKAAPSDRYAVAQVAWLFLKLGCTAFGGPAAHVALMENEVVRQRRWLTHPEFLDLLGATNLIPGPNSTEMAVHIGRRQAGGVGLVVAGSCFILPAAVLVGLLAWLYVRYGALPGVEAILGAIKPVILAVIAQALWNLGRAAVKSVGLAIAGAAAAVLAATGLNELIVLFGTGLVLLAIRGSPRWAGPKMLSLAGWGVLSASTAGPVLGMSAGAAPFSFGLLFLFFLKVGSVLFGSGYVLLAFLQADLVERWQWLTQNQLMDAIAIGQVTPGPLFTTATFIGYVLGGWIGAVLATLGIFLPAFLFVAISAPVVPKLRASALTGAFLDGVNVASLALMGVVTWQLGFGALRDGMSWALAIGSAILLLRFSVNPAWLVFGGGMVGWVRWWAGG